MWTNTPIIRRILRLTLRAIGYADVRYGILPSQSTKLPEAISDSRRLAMERKARRGEAQGWAEQSRPLRNRTGQRSPQRLYALLLERSVVSEFFAIFCTTALHGAHPLRSISRTHQQDPRKKSFIPQLNC
nr:hypothetical protein [Dyella sp. ASV24]